MHRYTNANIIFSKFCNGYDRLRKDLPIRPSEMGVLNIIVQRQGKFTPVMIAELMDVSKPMITAHIASLKKRGYIYKEPLTADKRSFYILPTEKALKLVNESSLHMRTVLQNIEQTLGRDRFDQLMSLLDQTNHIIKELDEE